MSTRKELPGRLLRLLSLLQSRREWSGRDLADRLGVTDRTVRRDVERLRALDYPVTGTTGHAGGYRLISGKNVPPLLLDDDEAVAVAIGLTTAAGAMAGLETSSMSALAKLEQVLPARLRPKLAAVGGATEAIPRFGRPTLDPAILAVIAACCRDHEILAFDYQNRSGSSSHRRAEPHQLVAVQQQWYLLAYDPDRDDWRTFRADRISAVAPTRHQFSARELPAPDASSYVLESFANASYRHSARLRVELPAETVRTSFYGWVPGRVDPVGADACEVQLNAESDSLLIQYVAGIVALGADFTLTADPETAEVIRTVIARLQSAVS